ncbi:PREDICTED: reticuline oxidase-like protein [Tarenaya hassleriana]|uniref:reticuline oxidase-like protein n=1 Tax=Tarenaya hassleriana TaxID=28532 RepID=UPI00053C2358|nr:PREDICTED: reticuline oxidase-like protein [Tarenaya hassleriana]
MSHRQQNIQTETKHKKKIKKNNMKIFSLIFLLVFVSHSLAASDTTVYQNFLDCFAKQTKTSPDKLSDVVLPQSNAAFTPVLRAYIRNARFNTSATPKPAIIIAARSETHVQAAVVCTKSLNFQLKIRSGGHDYEGISYVSAVPFFVLDLSNLRTITVDAAGPGGAASAWIEAGATLGELYYRIWEKSKVHGFPAGICPTVGAGGHISGAGYGNMVRKHGLSVDYVTDAKIVDVNGRILDRKSMGEDLFWAIRGGGGGSFGVIVAFKVNLVPVPEIVTVFRIPRYLDENALDLVHKWQSVAPKTDPNLWMRLLLQTVTKNKAQTVKATVMALYLGRAKDVVSLLAKDFPELGLKAENCTELSWIQSAVWWDNHEDAATINPEILLEREPDTASFGKRKSDYVETEIPKEGLDYLFKKMVEVGKVGLVFNPYGGKMSEVPTTETPFPHRKKLFKIQHSMNWKDAGTVAENDFLNKSRTFYGFMAPFVSKNPRLSYLNYRDLDIGINDHGRDSYKQGEVYGRKYFAENFDRLVKVKTAVDPQNFFRNEQSIPTLPNKALKF